MMKRKIYSILSILFISTVLLTGCSTIDNSIVTKSNQITSKLENSEIASEVQKNTKNDDVSQQTTNSKVTTTNGNKQLIAATIVKNVDGDTIEINLNGKEEKIRMLCVDTPETHHPRLGVQPFGPEASDYTKKTLYVGRNVQIETGIGGGRDKYGRLLAYIYVDGKMFNEMLLEKGLARVAYIYAPNTKYVDEFYAIQKLAQQKGIGIWSIENYAKDDGFHPATKGMGKTTTPTVKANNYQNNPGDDQESNVGCKGKIKGNANSQIYHVPGGSFYDSTKDNIVWFCSEQEAQKAGFRKSKR